MSNKTNFIKRDGMFKQTILKEDQARKEWEEKWGFTKKLMKDYRNSVKAEGISLDKWKRQEYGEKVKAPYDHLSKPIALPRTSTGFIGWRVPVPVENVGPLYVSPKRTILPPDFEDLNANQKFIFIG